MLKSKINPFPKGRKGKRKGAAKNRQSQIGVTPQSESEDEAMNLEYDPIHFYAENPKDSRPTQRDKYTQHEPEQLAADQRSNQNTQNSNQLQQ